MKGIALYLVLVIIVGALSYAAEQEDSSELATYSVRWVHGGKTDFGKLVITTASLIFHGDEGENKYLAFAWLDEVRIVDQRWIQVRSNRETGVSWGMNDVYNFGVVGTLPDSEIIGHVNELIIKARHLRIENAEKLPGEKARYMVAKSEPVGDDIGLLIITDDRVIYRSDTGAKEHEWSYDQLTGIELANPEMVKIHTRERSILKIGLFHRIYRFVSQTGPFKPEDVGFIMMRISEFK